MRMYNLQMVGRPREPTLGIWVSQAEAPLPTPEALQPGSQAPADTALAASQLLTQTGVLRPCTTWHSRAQKPLPHTSVNPC